MQTTIRADLAPQVTTKAQAAGISATAWVNAAVSAALTGSDVFVKYTEDQLMVVDGGTP